MVLKQRKLDEALRAGASSRHVNMDKLMASTIHTLINYNIEFTPASSSQNILQEGSLKYILLKPENEPVKKQNSIHNIQSKRNVAKFRIQKFQHKEQNNKVKENTRDKKSIRKKRSKPIKKRRQKKQQQMNKN